MESIFLPFVFLAAALTVAAGCGALLLHLVGVRPLDRLQAVLESVGLGLGIIAYATLFFAACGILYPQAYLALVVVGVAGLWRFRSMLQVRSPAEPMPAWGWVIVALGLCLVGGELLKLMAPPIGGDQTKYQLVYPKLFAQAHGLVDTPWSFWGNMQYLLNWLFTAAFVFDGDVLARLFHAVFGLLSALAIYGFGRRCFGAVSGLVAAGVFFSAPMTTTLMVQAWVDLGVVFFTLMALWAFIRWWREGKGGDLMVAGILAGLAGATKPLGMTTFGVLGLGILLRLFQAVRAEVPARRTTKVPPESRDLLAAGWAGSTSRWLASGFAFAMVGLLAASPCYLRNLASTGNPVYPFAYGVFGGRAWSPEAASYLSQYYRSYRAEYASKRPQEPAITPLGRLAKVAWNLTMYPQSYEKTSRAGYDLSPFILACLPGALLLARHGVTAGVLGFGAAYLLVVGQVWIHPRYLLPGLVPWLIVCSAGLVRLFRGGVWRLVPVIVVSTTIGFSCLLSGQMLSWHWRDDFAVVTGRMTVEDYLGRYDKRFPLWQLVNSQVAADGRVLILEKIPHPYRIERSFVSGSYLEQGLLDYRSIRSPEEMLREVLRLGVTHVAEPALDKPRDPFEAHVFRLWRGFIARFCRPVGSAGGGKLYAVSAPGEVTMAWQRAWGVG